MSSHKIYRPAALAAVALLALTACGSSDQTAATGSATATASSSAASAAPSATSQTGLVAEESWIKANTSDMTGAFARITNTGDQPITITGARSSAAGMVELHTTVIDSATGTSTMKKVEGGFTIEPGATLELAPGSDHIMLMGMKCSLVAGASDTITLETSAGEYSFDAEVRDYSGAKEEYAPGQATSPAAETMGDSTDHSMHSMHSMDTSGTASAEANLPQCA
ncbi:copper chaperone PCu(A)C [Rothia sp. P4278]|uniref:copper chaperone PCu(A)C n=1 Tax=Rothia sp. P4278 TaxID=3402658 RepID=UPI003AE62967